MPDQTAPSELALIRAEIDALDDAMHDLLMRRAEVVARLAGSRAKGAGPAIRPGREAAMLRRLLARHKGALPKPGLVRLWRELLAAYTSIQGQITVAAFLPEPAQAELARLHFGPSTPITTFPDAAAALAEVAAGRLGIAALPAPSDAERWWCTLDVPRLAVTAWLPVFGPSEAQLVLVAPTQPDPSGADRSLIRLPAPDLPALAAAGLTPLRTHLAEGLVLAEAEGFLQPDDPRLPPGAALLGAFAVPDPGALAP